MKLVFELPLHVSAAVSERLPDGVILYCTPYNLDDSGKYIKGWLVVTQSLLILFEEGKIRAELPIAECSDFKAVALVGSGRLEAVVKGECRSVIRYTMSHVPRYTRMATVLNHLSEGREPGCTDEDDETTCPKCGRTFIENTRICPFCANKLAVMKKLWVIVKPFKSWMLLAALLFSVVTLLELFTPYIYGRFIDKCLIPMVKDPSVLLAYVGIITAASIMTTFLLIARGRLMVFIGSRLSRELRAVVFAKIQALSLSYISKRKTGDLMNRVTHDTAIIQGFVQEQSAMGINQMLVLIGICILLFVNNWKLALMVILPAPFALILCKLVWNRIRFMYHKQWKVWDKANSLLQDVLSGIRVVKTFGQEDREISRFKDISSKFAGITANNEKIWNTIFPLLGFVMGLGQFLVMYYGGNLVLGKQMRLGELVWFSSYAAMLYGPLSWMSFIPRWFAEAMTSTERVFELLDVEPDVKDHINVRHHKIKGKIEFKNVTFGYRSHEPVLENVDISIQPGEMIGLVGHSGAGKSTFINLLMRFYDADEGQILIDSLDIKDIAQQDLRSQIGVVLQETFLFSGTILDNIRYSKPDATMEEIINAAKVANAHDFIIRFPDAYDTKVGENGQMLSGGERQRIAIARAILHNPRILILDEATASLDTDTEMQIQEALERLIKDRTTFAIAHRLSTLRNANRLMVVEKGRIAETGTHDELLKVKGIYYKLVMAQRQITRMNNEVS